MCGFSFLLIADVVFLLCFACAIIRSTEVAGNVLLHFIICFILLFGSLYGFFFLLIIFNGWKHSPRLSSGEQTIILMYSWNYDYDSCFITGGNVTFLLFTFYSTYGNLKLGSMKETKNDIWNAVDYIRYPCYWLRSLFSSLTVFPNICDYDYCLNFPFDLQQRQWAVIRVLGLSITFYCFRFEAYVVPYDLFFFFTCGSNCCLTLVRQN